jgi:hypothetical protein
MPPLTPTETERIAQQLERVFYSNAWHGPALMETLAGIDAAGACIRPHEAVHNAWELVLHLSAWQRFAAEVLETPQQAHEVTPEEDWHLVAEGSEEGWHEALAALEDSHERLMKALSALTDEGLRHPVAGKPYNCYTLLHGVAQHSAYHAGQLALIRKWLR